MAKPEETCPGLADLRRIGVLRGLTEAELLSLAPKCTMQTLRARSHLVLAIEAAGRVGFVLKGSCRILAMAPNGAGVTIVRSGRGEAFGIAMAMLDQHHPNRTARLICDEATTFIFVSYKDFRELAEASPALCLASLLAVSAAKNDLSSRFYELATLDVRGRLLAELARMARDGEYDGQKLVVRAAPTHAELGDRIGAAREAVTRQLLDLERDGIISVGRREIVIEDIERLRMLEEAAVGQRQAARGDGGEDA